MHPSIGVKVQKIKALERDIALNLQAKLLRVVQDRKVTPIGSSDTVKIDTRILYATNRNLSEAVEKGKFRKDLYYRLKFFEINLPALKDRGEDVLLLAEHFTSLFCNQSIV